MASSTVVEEEQIQNDIENSDDELDETGKNDDQSTAKAKKRRRKKKKGKGKLILFKQLNRNNSISYT